MSPCGRTETVSTWLPSVRFGVESGRFLPEDRLTQNPILVPSLPKLSWSRPGPACSCLIGVLEGRMAAISSKHFDAKQG